MAAVPCVEVDREKRYGPFPMSIKRPENFILFVGIILAIAVITVGIENFGKVADSKNNSPVQASPTSFFSDTMVYHFDLPFFGDRGEAAPKPPLITERERTESAEPRR